MFAYAVVGLFCIIITILFRHFRQKDFSLAGEHFLITGGSSGIGKAFAEEVIQRGASVTLLARNKECLEDVKSKLLSAVIRPDQKVLTFTADVSVDNTDLKNAVKQAEHQLGPISFLVNSAGTSVCYRFEETPVVEFQRMLSINVLGSVYITQTVLPLMKQRKKGNIIFLSSLAGVIGIYGYAAYAASKFAVIGMAQALEMEVKPYGIGVTVSLPPDTDTPGFAEEIKVKLPETQLLCESGGLFSPNDVARKALIDAMNKKFMSSLGLEGWLLTTLCAGTSQISSYVELFTQVVLMGLCRLVVQWYRDNNEKKLARHMKSSIK